jgi:hypothetical protein
MKALLTVAKLLKFRSVYSRIHKTSLLDIILSEMSLVHIQFNNIIPSKPVFPTFFFFYNFRLKCCELSSSVPSCIMAHAIWPLTEEARVCAQVCPCGICLDKVSLGRILLRVLQFPPVSIRVVFPPWLYILVCHLRDVAVQRNILMSWIWT